MFWKASSLYAIISELACLIFRLNDLILVIITLDTKNINGALIRDKNASTGS